MEFYPQFLIFRINRIYSVTEHPAAACPDDVQQSGSIVSASPRSTAVVPDGCGFSSSSCFPLLLLAAASGQRSDRRQYPRFPDQGWHDRFQSVLCSDIQWRARGWPRSQLAFLRTQPRWRGNNPARRMVMNLSRKTEKGGFIFSDNFLNAFSVCRMKVIDVQDPLNGPVRQWLRRAPVTSDRAKTFAAIGEVSAASIIPEAVSGCETRLLLHPLFLSAVLDRCSQRSGYVSEKAVISPRFDLRD